MNKATARFFAEHDFRPPPGVKSMVMRQRIQHRFGPYTIVLETSCGSAPPRISGSVRIKLYDSRGDKPEDPVAVKRFAVDSWREAHDEMRRLERVLEVPRPTHGRVIDGVGHVVATQALNPGKLGQLGLDKAGKVW